MFSKSLLFITLIMALISYLFALFINLISIGAQSSGSGTFTNPVLNAVGADPYVFAKRVMTGFCVIDLANWT